MSDTEAIVNFNELAGNAREKRPLAHPLVQRYLDLMAEEYLELDEATTVKDTLDALCDLVVVAKGCMHVMGYDPDECMKVVNDSNMSKFCFNKKDATASCESYEDDDRYEQVCCEEIDGVWVIKGLKAGEEGGAFKILKGTHYHGPKWDDVL